MKNPCELCPIENTCGHAGGKPDKYQCGQRWEFNLIAARDKEWIAWAESQCPHGGIDSGGIICLECYQCWKDRKREVGQ